MRENTSGTLRTRRTPGTPGTLVRTLLVIIPLTCAYTTAHAQACGDGAFDPEELCVAAPVNVFTTPTPVRTVLAVDFNADSFSDIVAVTGNRILFRLGTATGLGQWRWWQYPGVDFRDVAAGDFDADGDLDVAIADRANDRLPVRWNLGGLSFSVPMIVPVGDAPVRVLSARLNADARDDLAVLNVGSQTATILLAAGGGFAAFGYGVGNTPDIALGDCNGDTQPDLIYVRGHGTATDSLPSGTPYRTPPKVGAHSRTAIGSIPCSQGGSTLYWFEVRIVARRALREFWEQHADAEQPLRAWYDDVRKADWGSPAHVKRVYANASIVGKNRIVFNIGGNSTGWSSP